MTLAILKHYQTLRHTVHVLGGIPEKTGRGDETQVQVATAGAIVVKDFGDEAEPTIGDKVVVLERGEPGFVKVAFKNNIIKELKLKDLKFSTAVLGEGKKKKIRLTPAKIRWNGRSMKVTFYRSELRVDSRAHQAIRGLGAAAPGYLSVPGDYAGWPAQ